jgi:hypothetical protein
MRVGQGCRQGTLGRTVRRREGGSIVLHTSGRRREGVPLVRRGEFVGKGGRSRR